MPRQTAGVQEAEDGVDVEGVVGGLIVRGNGEFEVGGCLPEDVAIEDWGDGFAPAAADEGDLLEGAVADAAVLEHGWPGLDVDSGLGWGGLVKEAEDVEEELGWELVDGGVPTEIHDVSFELSREGIGLPGRCT